METPPPRTHPTPFLICRRPTCLDLASPLTSAHLARRGRTSPDRRHTYFGGTFHALERAQPFGVLELTDLQVIDSEIGRFPGPPSVTPIRMCNAMRHKWEKQCTMCCPYCGHTFAASTTTLWTVRNMDRLATSTGLMREHYMDPRLVTSCLLCKRKLRMNPFYSDYVTETSGNDATAKVESETLRRRQSPGRGSKKAGIRSNANSTSRSPVVTASEEMALKMRRAAGLLDGDDQLKSATDAIVRTRFPSPMKESPSKDSPSKADVARAMRKMNVAPPTIPGSTS